jgi:mannonate dehydratase
MHLAFRWYGPTDPIPIDHIGQIPGVESAVSALYDIDPAEPWPLERLQGLKELIEAAGMRFDIVESIPVHDGIKLGTAKRDRLIETYIANLETVAAVGVSLVVYNFMPLFDWFRTDFALRLPDGSNCLEYDHDALDPATDPWSEGWPAYFAVDGEPSWWLDGFRELSREDLRANLGYFLRAVVPHCQRLGLNLGIHPDDPPWPIFGIARVVSNGDDLAWILDAFDAPANGLTLCVGSLGADPANDPVALAARFADRVHFVHARNVRHTGPKSFHEVAHPEGCGDVDLVGVLQALDQNGYRGPIRPDHGRMIWGETGTPGYGLYDRALGAVYLRGAIDGLRRATASGQRMLASGQESGGPLRTHRPVRPTSTMRRSDER